MKKIKLNNAYQTKNTGKYFTLVDDEDFIFLNQCSWTLKGRYVTNTNGVAIHRLIMKVSNNQIVDHIDNNPLNNQKFNLRIVTQSQNCQNRSKMKFETSSRFKGVYWNKENQKWLVQIRFNTKKLHIGLFENERQAAIAYDLWAIYFWGDYAKTNFKVIAHSLDIVLANSASR